MTLINFKKSYKFAFKSSLFICLINFVFLILIKFLLYNLPWYLIFLISFFLYLFSFYIIQFRVENFIYKRIKKIYDDVSLIENTSLKNTPIITDMATLSQEVKKFAIDKKLEIESLKIREEYRREFLGNVSHELKTPLFTVQGYILTLLDGAMEDKNIRKKYLQRAEKGVERLIYIVKDLDMITKLETGDLNLEPSNFDIVEVISNVFELLEMRAAKKNISLLFDKKYPITQVYADKDKIQQVITNLVMNSIKYGKNNGTTEVSIESITQSKYIIRITDNGYGIEKHLIPRIFERFYRIDKSGSRNEGGSGLGLAIVKHIIEGHNQKIYVESSIGMGSEFSFTLEKSK